MNTNKIANSFKALAINYGASMLESIVILLAGIIVIKILVAILRAIFNKTKLEGSIASFFISLLRAGIGLLIFFLILSAFKVDPKSIAAIVAASGLAVGFALKDSLSNLASGVLVLMTKPFKKDDLVSIGGIEGKVKKIKITTTELLTADNVKVIIPNQQIISASVSNFSIKATRRVDALVNVPYAYDPEFIIQVLNEVVEANDLILRNPKHAVEISHLGGSAVEYKVKMWTRTDDYFTVKNGFFGDVLLAFRKNNISEAKPVYEVVNREVKDD